MATDAEAPLIPFWAYLASPLTGVTGETRENVVRLRTILKQSAREKGWIVYDPYEVTDPIEHPEVSPQVVFSRDRYRVLGSDLLIALITQPTLGVGMELEMARSTFLPILILVKRDFHLSKMVEGMPGVKLIMPYDDESALPNAVQTGIDLLYPKIAERRAKTRGGMEAVLGPRVKQLREERGLSRVDLADAAATDEEDIEFIEANPDYVTNVGVPALHRIADGLGVKITDLFQDLEPQPEIDESEVLVDLSVAARKVEGVSARDNQTIVAYLRRVAKDPQSRAG